MRVLDLSTALSGPATAVIFADQGADVIKVEAPGAPDVVRVSGSRRNGLTSMFHMANRGKRAITIDLSQPQGLGVLHELVRRADVVQQNFRPGVVERMGIAYDDLRRIRPDLIYLSISGFGFKGPLSGFRVFDNVIQAVSGFAAVQGGDGDPAYVRNLICDKITALTAAQAVTAALFARDRGAGGQHIELSMLDASIATLWIDAGSAAAMHAPDAEIYQPGRSFEMMRHVDGWTTAMPTTNEEFRGWCEAFDSPEIATDPRFATHAQRVTSPDLPAARGTVADRAAKLTVTEALERMHERHINGVEVVALADLPAHPQTLANGTFTTRDLPTLGRLTEPAPAARFSATPAAAGTEGPRPGQHTDEILREYGYTDVAIHELRAAGTVA